MFEQRFWHDGTPRLTAYEYQGVLQSECHVQAELTCNDCHSMHDGDPKGMITEEKRTNAACQSCHQDISEDLAAHTGHAPSSEGSLCYGCHMPKIVYGIMTLHRSHRIESPNPVAEFNNNKPNACVACHLDKTTEWITQASEQWWPGIIDDKIPDNDIIQNLYQLHSGDPVERSIAANDIALNQHYLPQQHKYFLIPHLLFAMEDTYPAIRRFSHKALSTLINDLPQSSGEFNRMNDALTDFDFIADPQLRRDQLLQIWYRFNAIDRSQWPMPPTGALMDERYQLNIPRLIALRDIALSESKQIEIGE